MPRIIELIAAAVCVISGAALLWFAVTGLGAFIGERPVNQPPWFYIAIPLAYVVGAIASFTTALRLARSASR